MNTHNNVHFPDESPQAQAIRDRLAAGYHAFVHDTGNGLVIADPPITLAAAEDALAAGTYYQVAGPETRSAGVLSSWPLVPYDPAPDPNRQVTIFNRLGLVHAPKAVPATVPARKTLVSSVGNGQQFSSVRARFVVHTGEHRQTREKLSNWNLCWLQVGESWRGHVLVYLNYYPEKQWLRLTTNFGQPFSSAVHRDVRRVVLHEDQPYTVEVEYVAGSHAQATISTFTMVEEVATVRETRKIAPSILVDDDWRLAFGHERDEKDQKLEPGWGYQWLNVQLAATVAPTEGGSHA